MEQGATTRLMAASLVDAIEEIQASTGLSRPINALSSVHS
jgi:hypothetical protein